MKGLLIWLWLAQSADISTTVVGLNRGCVERTYWSQNPAVIGGGKVGGTIVLTWGGAKNPNSRGLKWMVGSLAASATAAAIINGRTIPKCR